MADADIAEAATKIAAAAFEASGQQCISAQRVLVQRPVLDTFLDLFVAAASKLKVGPAEDAATDLGPMVHAGAADRVMAMAADAVQRGGRAALGSGRNGCIVSPGILVDVPRESRLWREEVFGPLALVQPFDSLDEA